MSTPETVQVAKELFIIMRIFTKQKQEIVKKLRKNSAVSHIFTEIEVDSVRWIFN